MKRWMFIALSFCTLAAVAGAGYWGFYSASAGASPTPEAPPTITAQICDVKQTVTAPGNLVNTHQATLEMPANGSLEEVLARPGDHVQAGQTLARLADREKFTAAVTQARLDLLQANQELSDLKESAWASDKAQAQLDLANAQSTLDEARRKRAAMNYSRASDNLVMENAQTDYLLAKSKYKDALKAYNLVAHKRLTNPERVAALKALLNAKQAMERAFAVYNWYLLPPSEDDIAKADGEVAVAETNLAEAQAKWEQVQQGPDSLDLALAEAKVNNAQADLEEAQKDLAEVEIKAPFDGVVLEVHGSSGEALAAGATVFVLNDPQAVEIEATVTEEDFPSVSTGQEAEIYFDALPDEAVQGKISRILPARAAGDRPLYTIYLSLDNLPEKLVAGMTADSSITIAQAKDALCLPRSLVRASSGSSAVIDLWNGSSIEKRTVELGLRGDTYIQILSGLLEGDQVVGR